MENENKNRNVFSIHGVTGMLIATVLLISILVILTILGIKTQQKVAKEPYVLKDVSTVPMKANMKIANDVMEVENGTK
ncbi:DUF4006 family protein [Campylobacter ureolyticus]|uniref:DUF4006 family protein n=1 Tax=Campylobacter ureolyticus TaxID=827 RepID=UPI0022B4F6B0|nr:DUF4006 family protein [Campylobacter ureolyticus]MCZ6111691.1 DUF4006 family protein [Campylobacter ureolyticus]MCZ6186543.1 DUF4006 family protein [Campylobacter ureolyticus]